MPLIGKRPLSYCWWHIGQPADVFLENGARAEKNERIEPRTSQMQEQPLAAPADIDPLTPAAAEIKWTARSAPGRNVAHLGDHIRRSGRGTIPSGISESRIAALRTRENGPIPTRRYHHCSNT